MPSASRTQSSWGNQLRSLFQSTPVPNLATFVDPQGSEPPSLNISRDAGSSLPSTQVSVTVEPSGPFFDRDVVVAIAAVTDKDDNDAVHSIREFSDSLSSLQKDFENVRACFNWIDIKRSSSGAPYTDTFTKVMMVYERLLSQVKEDGLKLKVHGLNKFTLLVENVVLNKSLADAEVAGTLNDFLNELPSGPSKVPQFIDELERDLGNFRDGLQKSVPTVQPSQSLSTADINSMLRKDPTNFIALFAALGTLADNLKNLRSRLMASTRMLDIMKSRTQEYLILIRPPAGANLTFPQAPPSYEFEEAKEKAREKLEEIAAVLKPVGTALGDLAARLN